MMDMAAPDAAQEELRFDGERDQAQLLGDSPRETLEYAEAELYGAEPPLGATAAGR
jgi:hypothetical protein